MSTVVTVAVVLACAAFVTLAYRRQWQWTGLPAAHIANDEAGQRAKTLWDWLQLLGVPVALATLAFLLNAAQNGREQQREDDRDREATMRTYLTQMSDLMLDHRLLDAKPRPNVLEVARTATLTTVRRLDGTRKGLVVRFLLDSKLIRAQRDRPVRLDVPSADLDRAKLPRADLEGVGLARTVLTNANLNNANLRNADLSNADLSNANLYGADLSGATLCGATLNGADLRGADLRRANVVGAYLHADLHGASLSGANLSRADLSSADLSEATLDHADLRMADLVEADLSWANLNRASLHEADFRGANITSASFYKARDPDLSDTHGTPAAGEWAKTQQTVHSAKAAPRPSLQSVRRACRKLATTR